MKGFSVKKERVYYNNGSSMIITNLVRIVLIITYIRSWIVHDHSQDFLIILTFVMTYYPSVLAKKFGVYLPKTLQIIITLFIFASQYLGEMNGFYDKFTWWDTMLHAISGIILGLLGFMFVYLLNKNSETNVKLSPIFVVLFAFCFAITMGVFWEFFEYGADRLMGYNMQKFRMPGQDGLVDTMEDLIVDTIGAIVICVFGWLYIKQENDTIFTNYFDRWFLKDRKRRAEIKKGERNATNKEDI